jgi:hypothetical protein
MDGAASRPVGVTGDLVTMPFRITPGMRVAVPQALSTRNGQEDVSAGDS